MESVLWNGRDAEQSDLSSSGAPAVVACFSRRIHVALWYTRRPQSYDMVTCEPLKVHVNNIPLRGAF